MCGKAIKIKSVLRPVGLLHSKQIVALWFYHIKVIEKKVRQGWVGTTLPWQGKFSTCDLSKSEESSKWSAWHPFKWLPAWHQIATCRKITFSWQRPACLHKKTWNFLTVHQAKSSCCQVKFGFSLLRKRSEIFGSCPNVSLLSATPPMSQFQLEGIQRCFGMPFPNFRQTCQRCALWADRPWNKYCACIYKCQCI